MKQETNHITGEWNVVDGRDRDAIEFYAQEKVIVEHWPKYWSRKS